MKTPDRFIYKYLRYVSGPGSPSDDRDMNINGSSTPGVYEYTLTDDHVDFTRINFVLVDGSVEPGDFGGIAGGLTNGFKLEVIDTDESTVLVSFNDGETIKQNFDFIALAGVDAQPATYAADDMLAVRFTIERAGSLMRLKKGQSFRITIQDNLTAITKFRIMVQGVINRT